MSAQGQATTEPKRRVHHFAMLKQRNQPIVVVTAYDYPTGLAADEAGVDAILVGDSLGMVALGFESTIPLTMDMMVHHTAAVRRAVRRAFLIADMPYLSYQVSAEEAVRNAGRLVQEGGAEAVKIEGGREMVPVIRRILEAGIPVLGHIGLLPQSIHKLGGYRVQGRDDEAAASLLEDARALEEAGVFAIVLEAMDPDTATQISRSLHVPTIGIGAGRNCDGQVLVLSDLAGLIPRTPPKFAKRYCDTFGLIKQAIEDYREEVRTRKFPEPQHEY